MFIWRTRSTFAGIEFTIWSSLHIQQTLVQQISQTIRLEIFTLLRKKKFLFFTLGSIYSTNASGAEQMYETNNLNQT